MVSLMNNAAHLSIINAMDRTNLPYWVAQGNAVNLGEINDAAINLIRDAAASGDIKHKGQPATRSALGLLYAEEAARIGPFDLNVDSVRDAQRRYIKASRAGSFFGLNRQVRYFIFAAVATRRALRN